MDSTNEKSTCPQCGERRNDTSTCSHCGHRHDDPDNGGDLVAILETSDSPHLLIAKSILEGAEIPFFVQGDEALGLLPLGNMAPWPLRHGIAAVIRVPTAYAADARVLLEERPTDEQPVENDPSIDD